MLVLHIEVLCVLQGFMYPKRNKTALNSKYVMSVKMGKRTEILSFMWRVWYMFRYNTYWWENVPIF